MHLVTVHILSGLYLLESWYFSTLPEYSHNLNTSTNKKCLNYTNSLPPRRNIAISLTPCITLYSLWSIKGLGYYWFISRSSKVPCKKLSCFMFSCYRTDFCWITASRQMIQMKKIRVMSLHLSNKKGWKYCIVEIDKRASLVKTIINKYALRMIYTYLQFTCINQQTVTERIFLMS